MSGHGHVVPNADGTVARCGGPAICPECSQEAYQNKIKNKGKPMTEELEKAEPRTQKTYWYAFLHNPEEIGAAACPVLKATNGKMLKENLQEMISKMPKMNLIKVIRGKEFLVNIQQTMTFEFIENDGGPGSDA